MTTPKPVSAAFRTFREIFRFLLPAWARTGDGELVQYTEGVLLDAFAETCRQTAGLMFPSLAPSDALAKIGADRAIPLGFAEPEASYRNRLIAWRYPRGHRIRGNAVGLLEQIAAVFGNAVVAQTIDARGTRYTRAAGDEGAITVERGVSWDWDGEALTPNWARFWVVLQVEGARRENRTWDEAEAAGETWDASEDAGEMWDLLGVHFGQVNAVKQLVKVGRMSWVPGGRRPVYLVFRCEGESYPAPDGTWGAWANRPVDTHVFEPLRPSID